MKKNNYKLILGITLLLVLNYIVFSSLIENMNNVIIITMSLTYLIYILNEIKKNFIKETY